jgi:hypothetical protein
MICRSVKRFGDKIMRHFKKLAREPQVSLRNLRRLDCGAKPVPTLLIARCTAHEAGIDASAAGPYGPPPLRRPAR